MRNMKRPLAAYLGAALAAVSSTAHAQDPGQVPAGDDISGEDIVVTARRVDERAQDVPLAITALGAEALRRQAIRDISDLSSIVPNLNIQDGNTGAGTVVVAIRGQNQANVQAAVDASVSLYTDGVNIPQPYGLRAALIDLKRIEVLRGPQGTLYGRNTTGGAVSYFTNDPAPEFGGSVELTGGNYGAWSAMGVLNVPLAENVGIRLVAQHRERDGFGVNPLTGQDIQALNSDYARLKFGGGANGVRASLTADYFDYDSGAVGQRLLGITPPTAAAPGGGGSGAREAALFLGLPTTPAGLAQAGMELASYIGRGDFYDTFAGGPLQAQVVGGTGALNVEIDLTDALIARSITGFRGFRQDWKTDNDGTPFAISETVHDTEGDFWSEELQLLGSANRFQWVVGGYFSTQRVDVSEISTSLGRTRNNNLNLTLAQIDDRSLAVFGQGTLELVDNLRVTLGARYTWDRKQLVSRNATSAAGCSIGAALVDTPGVCLRTNNAKFSDPSWLASVDYRPAPNLLAYGKVSRGFRSGGHQLRASGTDPASYAPYAPETVTEYEVGFKGDVWDKRINFSLALFQDEYRDVQRSIVVVGSTGALVSVITNAAKARLRGIEAEARARVGNGLSLRGSLGILDPKYLEYTTVTGGDRRGEAWPTPKWNYTIGADYRTVMDIGALEASLNWVAQAKQDLSPQAINPLFVQPSYGLLNGRIGVDIDRWDTTVSVVARNLLDKKYYTTALNLTSFGVLVAQPGEPRTVFAQITKRF